jgi:hypothetical protein
VTRDEAAKTCPTCKLVRKSEHFYAASAECRDCKRLRSQLNRSTAAQKVALADRLLEMVERLVDQGWRPDMPIAAGSDAAYANSGRPPAVSYHQPEASIGSQEVQP